MYGFKSILQFNGQLDVQISYEITISSKIIKLHLDKIIVQSKVFLINPTFENLSQQLVIKNKKRSYYYRHLLF